MNQCGKLKDFRGSTGYILQFNDELRSSIGSVSITQINYSQISASVVWRPAEGAFVILFSFVLTAGINNNINL